MSVGELRRHVRPAAVVVTGDLTDAKTEDHVGSGQLRAEWDQYREVGAVLVLQKVTSEANPKVRNHGEGPY